MEHFRLPEITPFHIQEAERFQEGLENLYDRLQRDLQPDEEIAIYYDSTKERIRITNILMSAKSVLIVAGRDPVGNETYAAGYYKSMNLIYKKIKIIGETKERTRIGFSIAEGKRDKREESQCTK